MNAPKLAAAAAASRSASSSTTNGALPPSSSSVRLKCPAARDAMIRPTRVEPVKLMWAVRGSSISAPTISPASAGALQSRLTTPAGAPASASAATIAACTRGDCSEALRMTVLPSASAHTIARVPRITGAFQGAIPTHTPSGSRTLVDSSPGTCEATVSSSGSSASSPAARYIEAASETLNIPQPNVPPVSSVTTWAICSARDSRIPAAVSSSSRRASGGVAAHPGSASAAAVTAAPTSSRPAAACTVATSPV